MSSKQVHFRAPPFIFDMLDALTDRYKCTRTELLKLLITDRYHELELSEIKKNNEVKDE